MAQKGKDSTDLTAYMTQMCAYYAEVEYLRSNPHPRSRLICSECFSDLLDMQELSLVWIVLF